VSGAAIGGNTSFEGEQARAPTGSVPASMASAMIRDQRFARSHRTKNRSPGSTCQRLRPREQEEILGDILPPSDRSLRKLAREVKRPLLQVRSGRLLSK